MSDATSTTTGPPHFRMAEAALNAFRDRGRRGVLIGATLTFYLFVALIAAACVAVSWRGLVDYVGWLGSDPMRFPPASVLLLCASLLSSTIALSILGAAYEAACLRWMVRGETGGVFGLTLGADTWRVWAVYWMWLALILAFYLVIVLIAVAAYLAANAAKINVAGVMAFTLLGVIAAIVSYVWLLVRLAPAAATSIAAKRFAFFDAWTVTRGRFWTLFGAFLLVFIAYYAAGTIAQSPIYLALGAFFELMANTAAGGAPPTGEQVVAAFAEPAALISLGAAVLLSIVVGALYYLALFGVSARAVVVAQQEGRI